MDFLRVLSSPFLRVKRKNIYLIVEKASKSLSMMVERKCSNLAMASRVKISTSEAEASSLTESDRNSIRRGMTVAATSGNLMQHECNVRTRSCLYLLVSSTSPRAPAPVPEVLLISYVKIDGLAQLFAKFGQ